MVSKASRVRILTSVDQGHLLTVDQVVQELGEELGQPPHAHQIAARRIISILPTSLLALVQLLLVVVTVATDHTLGDLFVDHGIEGQGCFLAEIGDHKCLVLLHDTRLIRNI